MPELYVDMLGCLSILSKSSLRGKHDNMIHVVEFINEIYCLSEYIYPL